MTLKVIGGILIPFLGTCLGAAGVFLMKKGMGEKTAKAMNGFASGVMVSAAFFSLILPAIEQSASLGKLAFVPGFIGFLTGMLFLLVIDSLLPHMHLNNEEEGRPVTGMKKTTKLFLAVTIHNLPEGMAVGVVFAGWIYGNAQISLTGAIALAVGIAIQNVPEGAIVSMPLRAEGASKIKTFFYGVLSGAVEPVGALLTIAAASVLLPVLPYLLTFAAGAMMYVVVEELIPEMSEGRHSNIGTICFAIGFVIMMTLDIGL